MPLSEDWERRKAAIAGFYDELAGRYGTTHRACGWGGSEGQRIRFEVLAQVMPLAGKRVLDVGCGFGDFADFLRGRHDDLTYEGVDITPRMVLEANRRHPALSIRVADILREDPGGPYDLVTANGIFYVPAEGAEARMRELIARMFELAIEAVAFTSLSAWAPRQEPGEFYADPLAVLGFCRTLTPWVVLRHDYLAHDFTVYAYRGTRR